MFNWLLILILILFVEIFSYLNPYMIGPVQYDLNVTNFLNYWQKNNYFLIQITKCYHTKIFFYYDYFYVTHVKATFQKSAKIPISIEIVHFLFLLLLFNQFTRFLFFKNFFRKLIKFSLIFCIQNKKKFFQLKNACTWK